MEVILSGRITELDGKPNAYEWTGKWCFKGNRSRRSTFVYRLAFNGQLPQAGEDVSSPPPEAPSSLPQQPDLMGRDNKHDSWPSAYDGLRNSGLSGGAVGVRGAIASADDGHVQLDQVTAMDVDMPRPERAMAQAGCMPTHAESIQFPAPSVINRAREGGTGEGGAGSGGLSPAQPPDNLREQVVELVAETGNQPSTSPPVLPKRVVGMDCGRGSAGSTPELILDCDCGDVTATDGKANEWSASLSSLSPVAAQAPYKAAVPHEGQATAAECEGHFTVCSTTPVTHIEEQFVLTLSSTDSEAEMGGQRPTSDVLFVRAEGENVYGAFQLVGSLTLSKMWLACHRCYDKPERKAPVRRQKSSKQAPPPPPAQPTLERRTSTRANLGVRKAPLYSGEREAYAGCDHAAITTIVEGFTKGMLRLAWDKWLHVLQETEDHSEAEAKRARTSSGEGCKAKGKSSCTVAKDHGNGREWVSGQMDDEGSIYEGEMREGERHGVGLCVYQNGFVYQGQWRYDKEHGRGSLLIAEDKRVVYEGDWVDGKVHGKGRHTFHSGAVYEGEWRENMRWGKGTYRSPDGHSYDGDWREDLRWGYGVFTWTDGAVYEGEWSRGIRQGRGTLRCADGMVYSGHWMENRMEGKGTCTYPDGSSFEGTWRNGKREGRGTLTWPNGASYEGRFRDDQIDGQGTLEIPRPVPGLHEGDWVIPLDAKDVDGVLKAVKNLYPASSIKWEQGGRLSSRTMPSSQSGGGQTSSPKSPVSSPARVRRREEAGSPKSPVSSPGAGGRRREETSSPSNDSQTTPAVASPVGDRRAERERRQISEFEHRKPQIIKTNVEKPAVRRGVSSTSNSTSISSPKRALEEVKSADAVPVKRKPSKRKVKAQPYRGNLHLIQRVNKDAARTAMKGSKLGKQSSRLRQSQSKMTDEVDETPRVKAPMWAKGLSPVFKQFVRYVMPETTSVVEERAKAVAKSLNLTEDDYKKIKTSFDSMDADGSGSVDLSELFERLDEVQTPFTDAIFAMIDLDGNGSLDLEEYMRIICTYCMCTEEDVLRFCFDCYDVDGSGTIDETELITLCHTVNYANPLFTGNFHKMMESFDINSDGFVDFLEFASIYRRFPMTLFPAFRLQDSMQRLTLGHNAWAKIHASVEEQRRILAYRASHGGADPPVPSCRAFCRCCCPSLYKPVKICPAVLEEAQAMREQKE